MNPEAVKHFINSIMDAFADGDPNVTDKSSERSNVAILRAQYTAIAHGDLQTFASTLSDNVELEIIAPPELPFRGHWKGKRNVLEAVIRNFAMLEDQRPEILTVVAQGDTVIVFAREAGRIKASKREYLIHWMQRFTFQNGFLLKMTELADTSGLMK